MKLIITFTMMLMGFYFSQGQSTRSEVKVKNTSSNTSISVSKTHTDFSYSARFNGDKTDRVRTLMEKELGKPASSTEKTAVWEGKGYSASVTKGRVSIEAENDKLTKSFLLKLEELADEISEALDGPKTPEVPEPPKPPRIP